MGTASSWPVPSVFLMWEVEEELPPPLVLGWPSEF